MNDGLANYELLFQSLANASIFSGSGAFIRRASFILLVLAGFEFLFIVKVWLSRFFLSFYSMPLTLVFFTRRLAAKWSFAFLILIKPLPPQHFGLQIKQRSFLNFLFHFSLAAKDTLRRRLQANPLLDYIGSVMHHTYS